MTVSRKQPLKTQSLLARTRNLLRRSGLRARKGLAQHFLVDEEVLKLVVETANLTPADIVIEVGPGLGVLTAELARKAGRVLAIELDSKLAAVLKQTLASFENVTIINEDVLKTDPATLLREQKIKIPSEINAGYKVVANLPYYITSPVLRHFLEASLKPQTMVVMVQKEVAESIAAAPGQMSLLSVSVQFYGRPTIVSHVPADSFYPPPEVDSAILKIDVYPQPPVPVNDVEGFFDLVRAGFTASRKQIANSLTHGLKLPKSDVLPLLERSDIAPRRRAETLTLEEWAHLWQVFTRRGESI
jgi:16S rRNA (adenine1518-N6/adenine1519-N6)-dimethyltransferase